VPIPDWPLPVVMVALRERLLTPPWLDETSAEIREASLHELIRALEAAGIDALNFIRYGLGDRLERALISGVVVARAIEESHATRHGELGPEPRPQYDTFLEEWRSCRGAFEDFTALQSTPFDPAAPPPYPQVDPPGDLEQPGTRPEIFRRLINDKTIDLARCWVQQASIAELIGWTPSPARGPWEPLQSSLVHTYRWLVERMTVTYPAQWATTSLHLEWRWQNGQLDAPFSPTVLDERVIDPVRLNSEIAQRAATEVDADPGLTLDQVKDQALRLLARGDRHAAAGLFEAICSQQPDNAEAQNDLGFCLLPDMPTEAMACLVLAMKLGYDSAAINAVNRMQGNLLTGQLHSAIGIAREIWATWDRHPPRASAHLWSLSGDVTTVRISDARTGVLALAASAARAAGDDEAGTWDERHKSYCADCNEDAAPCAALSPLHL